MKKHLITVGKAISFFIAWGILLTVMMISAVNKPSFLNGNPALLRLWWEAIPLISIMLVTTIFICVVEKNKIKVPILKNPLKNIVWGLTLGSVWISAAILFPFLFGMLKFEDKMAIPYLVIWFFAVLLNAIMQEYLVRGYLFSLFREKYNTVAAVIITTILFTAMHGGVFGVSIIAVLNVLTMSVFVSLLLIYTESLLAPIIAHFIWNSVGCLIFGVISLADDYPNLWNITISGKDFISGGSAKLEGSIVVLFLNLLLILLMVCKIKKYNK